MPGARSSQSVKVRARRSDKGLGGRPLGPVPAVVFCRFVLATGMAAEELTVDQIVRELLEEPLTKSERMRRFRELVRRGDEVPDELLDMALRKLMERLAE